MNYFEINETHEGKRIDLFNENWYYSGGVLYPSVTFILGATIDFALAEYFKMHGIYSEHIADKAKEIGSLFHKMVENLIKTKSVNYLEFYNERYFIEAWKRLPNFVSFWDKHLEGHEIIEVESTVIGENYAGTMDLITYKDGVRHVWDWKSSKQVIEHHKIQVAAYAMACNAEVAHVVAFPEYPQTKQGYSLTTLDAEQIADKYLDFLFYKTAFDRKYKEPIIKSLPIQMELK